ncbi:Glycoside hydrolase, family 28 [Dillenia turbinata]|uniref:endo-polygalacturonase n=1 Tax=Dillenia turbinata TaxID=194707 RepID=A0AAN8ZLF7_9MAGN
MKRVEAGIGRVRRRAWICRRTLILSQEDPHSYNQEVCTGYDFQAYPSYFGNVEDDDEFKDFLKVGTEMCSLKGQTSFNVDDFGAKGDGHTDDSKAFLKAWEEACSSSGAIFLVPQNKNYFLKPSRFSGPCKPGLRVQIEGTIEASEDTSDYGQDRRHWIVFEKVQNFIVQGGGTINGNGNIWWQNSCKINKSNPCKDAPTALTFYECKNLAVNNLKIKDAQQIHVSFQKCVNVQASNLIVEAPMKSPNTDGIHITNTQNIQISSSTIGTGDDCISIVSGSQKVQATDITCGPGHGISIGSLGSKNLEAFVSDVVVNGAKLSGTTNGVRIKTWQGGSGSASNIRFQNIEMNNVTNPIIIDQNYCDRKGPCQKQGSAVQVKDVVYQDIRGTSASDVAIKFDCSKEYPCQGIVLENVKLVSLGTVAKAMCNNVKLTEIGFVSPHCP